MSTPPSLGEKCRNTIGNPFVYLEELALGCNQTFLQLLKTSFTLLSPFELGVLLQQLRHGLCNPGEILNEPPVVSRESKKTPDLSNCRGCFPICHGDNFVGVYYYSFSGYNMSKKSNFLQPKLTLAELGYN